MGQRLSVMQPSYKTMHSHKMDLSIPLSNPNILCALVKSNFLTARETGRLFFVTAKSIRMSVKENKELVDEDALWTKWCIDHWGEKTTKQLLCCTDLTYKECFRALAFPLPRPVPSVRPRQPVRYRPEDYVVVVQAKLHGSDIFLVCTAVSGAQTPDWFSKNKRRFTGPIGEKDPLETLPRCSIDELMHGRWDIDVHLLRLPDRKISHLMHLVKTYCDNVPFAHMNCVAFRGSSAICCGAESHLVDHHFDRDVLVHFDLWYRKLDSIGCSGKVAIDWFGLYPTLDRYYFGCKEGCSTNLSHFLEAMDNWRSV